MFESLNYSGSSSRLSLAGLAMILTTIQAFSQNEATAPAADNVSAAAAAEVESPPDPGLQKLREATLKIIPADRRHRELLADVLVIAYEGRGYRNLWEVGPESMGIYRNIRKALNSHAFPELMALDPEGLVELLGTAPVDPIDLARTIALLDAGLLARLGTVPAESIWPKWNSGDTPGLEDRSAEGIARDLILAASVSPFDVERVVDTLGPKNWIYQELRAAYPEAKEAILRYSGLPNIPDPATAGVGRPGEAYPYAPAVAAHLVDRGYLELSEEQVSLLSQMTPELTAALTEFQKDYGLDTDGIFGPASWRYLNMNAAAFFRTVVINMHRARLLPSSFGERYLLANLPSAELFGFGPNNFHDMTMRIVHGQAEEESRHTPVFRDVMQEIVFGPYWNVPKSIATKEILPKAQGDWGYLSRHHYEIVSDFNPYNKETHRLSPQNLELVAQGRLFLRQKPGPSNSLGHVKFLFPNSDNIYMHDTPAKSLFARSNRDYSHGCVRVAKPEELGAWVLQAQDWRPEEVKEAMFADIRKSQRVDPPVNVYITYLTMFPRPVFGGKIVLAPGRDVYDKDPADSRTLAAILPWVEPEEPTIP
ncbi:MAG: L,D-transpeptidase family protein [Verrucomicrobiota bacterium]